MRSRLLPAVLGALLGPSLLSAQAACPPAFPFQSVTTYTSTTSTASAAGAWVNTSISLPVTILNVGQIGVWQRPVTYTVQQEVTTVVYCWRSRWDRFVANATQGLRLSTTVAPGPLHNSTVTETETAFCLTSTPPDPDLPAERTDVRVGALSPSVPGSARPIEAFGSAADAMALRTLDPEVDDFSTIVAGMGSNYLFGAALFEDLATEIGTLDDPEGLRATFQADFFQLALGMSAVGQDLADGVVENAAALESLSGALLTLSMDFPLLGEGGLPYLVATGDLRDASDALLDAVVQLNTDLYGAPEPRFVEGTQFLRDVDSVGVEYGAFASTAGAVARQQAVVPEPVTLALVGAGLAGIGAVAWRRRRTAAETG